jgi:hypothetical protein
MNDRNFDEIYSYILFLVISHIYGYSNYKILLLLNRIFPRKPALEILLRMVINNLFEELVRIGKMREVNLQLELSWVSLKGREIPRNESLMRCKLQ